MDSYGVPQQVFYDWGVGSYGGQRISGGAFGAGLDKNIQDAYRFLVHNYVKGDEIYLFGFSRGAYTARSVAGLIRNAGILKKLHAHLIPASYLMYRRRAGPDVKKAREFRRAFCHEVRITFIGVWDTVGALGIPSQIVKRIARKRRYQFHDTSLSKIIYHACHAVAIDEKRIDFEPTLWENLPKPKQNVEQLWFAGVHGDVGGGYREKGLSDTALEWMWSRAATHGLAFSRAYKATFLEPDSLDRIHRSWKGMYWVKGRHHRPIGALPSELEGIHPSVRERYLAMRYRPKKLVEFLKNNPWPNP